MGNRTDWCRPHLVAIPDGLGEDAVLIAQSIAIGRQAQGCHGIQEAGYRVRAGVRCGREREICVMY